MEIDGWSFITDFANRGKADKDGESKKFVSRKIPIDKRFLKDIIAGRPVFGMPNQPGGFRLRYGRPRASGLAAAGMNPASMRAMGDFLSVGTQMKIERPGKACAITPTAEIDGPTVLLSDGAFRRIQTEEDWLGVEADVRAIWDNGELMLGFGEFLENNKKLVPSYTTDWWASDVLDSMKNQEDVDFVIKHLGSKEAPNTEPPGVLRRRLRSKEMRLENEWALRDWHRFLREAHPNWDSVVAFSKDSV